MSVDLSVLFPHSADLVCRLKCNRSSPCENCVKRGDASSCSYASPSNRNKRNAQSHGSSNSPDDMQNRIDRLEGLVLSLMTNGAQSAGPAAAAAAIADSPSTGSQNLPDYDGDDKDMLEEDGQDEDSDTEQVTKSIGIMKVSDKQTLYIGEAHWAAVLNDVGNPDHVRYRTMLNFDRLLKYGSTGRHTRSRWRNKWKKSMRAKSRRQIRLVRLYYLERASQPVTLKF